MILCLDVGNTQIYCGLFSNKTLLLTFRFDSKQQFSADQFGVFLRSVLREHQVDYQQIQAISICSVVPHLDYTLRSACTRYFSATPFFLQAGVKTGLKIKYKNPQEVGADRIANAVGAVTAFPNRPLIIVDFGTATTFCAITADKTYLGGVIMAGIRLSMDALQNNTAKLSSVKILKPESVIGTTTQESIQIGLYYSQLASVREISERITKTYFKEKPLMIGTGGFAHLFNEAGLFDSIIPDLVLQGLLTVLSLNNVDLQNKVNAE